MNTNHPLPLSGGSYRVIDGELVREDAPSHNQATPAEATPPIAPEPATEPTPALRGRKPSREE